MNEASGYCEGCYRSIPEITEWSRASDARKQAILGEVAARRQLPIFLSWVCAANVRE
jgi:predicted Fe-S protein YdhL (DUF1289 family)